MKISLFILALFFLFNLNGQILVTPVTNFKVTFVQQSDNTIFFTLDSSVIKLAKVVLLDNGKFVAESGIYEISEIGNVVKFDIFCWSDNFEIIVYPMKLNQSKDGFEKEWFYFKSKLEFQPLNDLTKNKFLTQGQYITEGAYIVPEN